MLRSRKSRLIADSRIRHTCRGSSCDSRARGRHRGAVLERAGPARDFCTINELRAPPGALKILLCSGGSDGPTFRSTVLGNPHYARGRLPHAEWVDARGVAAAL